jgi:hypothetical protein
MYVEPHYVDIDLWLYKGNTAVAHTSDYSLADEVIFYTMSPGQYRVSIYYFSTFTGSCPSTLTEISIVPTARLAQRVSSYPCPPTQTLPDLDLSAITVTGFYYDSTQSTTVLNAQYTAAPGTNYAFLKSYSFTLPKIYDNGDAWEIEGVLGFHFPTSGLGLLIQSSDTFPPTNLTCYDIGNCSMGLHNVRGQSTLKVLLQPGSYVLWLYDVPSERDLTLNQCSPFTFSLSISHAEQMEDFLNCPGTPFPTSINEAGLLDEHGFMYFREDVIVDLENPYKSLAFTVKQDSYFRAFAVAHRIDIDLLLQNSSRQLAYGYQYGTTEEGIQSFISAGNYTFQFRLFGRYEAIFCETALIEIAIAPASLYAGFDTCTGKPASVPDFSGLANVATTLNYNLELNNVYRYLYNGVYTQALVTYQSFTLTVASYIQATLGSNFLLGDVRIWLTSTAVNGTQLGYHRRNIHFLDVMSPPGNYLITIVTGSTQNTAIYNFPTCSTYSLTMSITPANATAPLQCLANRRVPASLNTPQNLNTSPKIHIQEEFLIPPISTFLSTRETIIFTVNTTSYFRAYTEPHHIDIDLKLDEEGITVAQTIKFNTEEVLSWVVRPGYRYTFTLTYYKWFFLDHGNDPCYTYQGEIAITPITENIAVACNTNYLPPDLGSPAQSPINIDDDFYFTQVPDPSDFKVRFSVPATSMFRVLLTYDFLWNDVALRLDMPGSSDPLQGELGYNKNEISLQQLSPGNYTLHIYEPFNTTTGRILALRNCVQFHMTLALEVIDNSEIDPLLLSCPDQYFPTVFNSPAFISALSGNSMDFDRYVLADVTAKYDAVTFTVATDSMFRVYIPVHPVLDVDVMLYRGTTLIASQLSYGEEEFIQAKLLANYNYTLRFAYYGAVITSILPPASDCESFRIQMSIYNITSIASVPPLSSECATNFSPALDPRVASNALNYQRSLDIQTNFYAEAFFTIKTTYLFTVKLEQNDASSGIQMLLVGMNVSKTYYPLYFLNHVYLNEYIPAGTYNLSFHSLGGINPVFTCAPYSLTSAYLITDFPADSCSSDSLPTDLFSFAGGSAPFGGPQAADGSIHLFGSNFVALKGTKYRNNYILFQAKVKSYLRIFLAVEDKNTITVNLFKNINLTSSVPMAATVAANSYDRSNVWVLPAQPDVYVLDLFFSTVGNILDCNYFTFELVLEPESLILSSLACPNPMPNELNQLPPETIIVYAQQDYSVYSSRFLVTRYLDNYGKPLSTTDTVFRCLTFTPLSFSSPFLFPSFPLLFPPLFPPLPASLRSLLRLPLFQREVLQ